MTTTFVGCQQTDRVTQGDKYRVTFSQTPLQNWLMGGTIASVYSSVSLSPWCYVVSEPPVDNEPVFVCDIRISHSTVGASPPGTVGDLLNSLLDLTFYNAYEVTRLEKLTTTAPVLEQRSQVINQALKDQADAANQGIIGQGKEALNGLEKFLKGARGVIIAVAIAAAVVGAVYVVREARALKQT